MDKKKQKTAKEIADIRHAYNNLFNTLYGYAELASEAGKHRQTREYAFFVRKLCSSVIAKMQPVRQLAARLSKLQEKITGKTP
jgi:hypothetical protein